MKFKHKSMNRLFTLGLTLVLGSLLWVQASPSPAAAQSPEADPVGMTIRIDQAEGDLSLFNVESPPVFNVGDQFKISIIAENVGELGIFGSQFEVFLDPAYLQIVEGSFVSGSAMVPVVTAIASVDNEAGTAVWAASRQGNLDNVSGNVVLATLTLEAILSTEPPEGQTTAISLDNVKLGAKGGVDAPISGLVGLDVIIRDDGTTPDGSDITGIVTVEGRAEDNQAGHAVTALGDLGEEYAETTDETGFFFLNNLPDDTYLMNANSPGFLAAACTSVAHTMDTLTDLANVQLLAGDIDDDGFIDITDAVAVGSVFGNTEPEIADLNIDGIVDILDLILMSANYGETSEGNPWICELPDEL